MALRILRKQQKVIFCILLFTLYNYFYGYRVISMFSQLSRPETGTNKHSRTAAHTDDNKSKDYKSELVATPCLTNAKSLLANATAKPLQPICDVDVKSFKSTIRDRVNIAFFISNESQSDLRKSHVMMKSMLMFTKAEVRFNMFCNQSVSHKLLVMLRESPILMTQATFAHHVWPNSTERPRAKYEGPYHPSSTKTLRHCNNHPITCMFLTLIQRTIDDHVIILHAESLVLVDIAQMLRHVALFRKHHVVALPLAKRRSVSGHVTQQNYDFTGFGAKQSYNVLAFNLDMARMTGKHDYIDKMFNEGLVAETASDAEVFDSFIGRFPQVVYPISCAWDVVIDMKLCVNSVRNPLCNDAFAKGARILSVPLSKEEHSSDLYDFIHGSINHFTEQIDNAKYWARIVRQANVILSNVCKDVNSYTNNILSIFDYMTSTH